MKKGFLVIICTCLLMPAVGFAANMRDYIPAPPDTLLSMLYYHHISGDDLNVNGNKAADVDLSQNLFLLREVYYTKIGSIVADPQVILPFGNGSLEAGGIEQDSDGIGDLILLCTFWVVNNPESKTYVGLTPYFYLPTGEYDENQSFNMGANRYAFQGEVGFVKGWEVRPGHNLYFEVAPSFFVYGDNDDYLGNNELSQDPVFALESHLSYDLTQSLALGLSYYGQWGDESEVNGYKADGTEINTQTIGATMAYNFAPGWQFLLQYKQDVKVDYGVEAEVIQARLFYATDFGKLFH
ncbi:transporter [Desulfobulbus propionicus]